MKKKYWLMTALWAMCAGVFTACDDNDDVLDIPDDPQTEETAVHGAYVVNNGGWGANNGSFQFYYADKDSVSADLYQQANGSGIGDAQDLCVYGSKLYVACTTSSKLEVLEHDGTIIKTLPLNNAASQPIQPRYLAADGGKVYFSAYDGTVSRIDTLSLEVEASVVVGSYPEAITVCGGKLYANISNYGMGSEVAVVDLSSFTLETLVPVKLNPYTELLTANGKVYVVSVGNYSSPDTPEADRILSTLQCIDPANGYAVTDLCNASLVDYYDGKMYIIYAEYYWPDNQRIFTYDLTTGQETELGIDLSSIPNPACISVDPQTGDIYIGSQDYAAPSTVYVFNNEGTPKTTFQAGYFVGGLHFIK